MREFEREEVTERDLCEQGEPDWEREGEREGERGEGACTWKLFGIWGFFKFWKPVDGGVLLPPSPFFFFIFFSSLLFSGSISYNASIIELIYESSDYLLLLN